MSLLTAIQTSLSAGGPVQLAEEAFARANSNAGRNVFLAMDQQRTLEEAEALNARFPKRPLLFGVPIAIKDCFDAAGYPTTCGSRFYAAKNGIAKTDSAVVARLREAGAVIMGKTHLHQLAYGITGENSEYGDCVQPRDATLLTGGSSSGSAASVQEGSAMAAIGTDTGGSIRVPAALCGLAGYRATIGLGGAQMWDGGMHLAASFDTIGESFLHDCEPAVLEVFRDCKTELRRSGAHIDDFEPDFFDDSREIFFGIQAQEASALHRGNFDHFEQPIAERLAQGAALSDATVADLRRRHAAFRQRMDELLQQHDFLMLPCAPMSALPEGADHSLSRPKILRYTTPASLAGVV
jgi:Asp-tRNA(Asn)/Glu-tRNA(Gln) amidotransferase A subunit family amidase